MLEAHLKQKGQLECSSDGELANGRGSMGFAITTRSEVLWKGSGPVDGLPDTVSSRRLELFGLAGLFELLLMVKTIHAHILNQQNEPIKVQIWVDSTRAIKQMKGILQRPNNADTLAHIWWLLPQLTPYKLSVEWLKPHQDSHVPVENLTVGARVNKLVDELATAFRQDENVSMRVPSKQPHVFPAELAGKWPTGDCSV